MFWGDTMSTVRQAINVRLVENYLGSQGISPGSIVKVKANGMEVYEKVSSDFEFITGLLLGKIQSGKTNGFLMSMAIMADNAFKQFIVLTSDDNWLYDQTIARIRESGLAMYVLTKDRFNDYINLNEIKESYNGIIVVTTKNATQSSRVKDIIVNSGLQDTEWIVIDDEADQASLNTNNNNPTRRPSRINSNITGIFDEINVKAFIQVTATPQSLLLQRPGVPFRPDFIVIIEPGEDYIGGDTLFGEGTRGNYLRIYDSEDIDVSIPDDGGIHFPPAFKDSINTFLISATAKILAGKGNSFSYICNVSLRQDDHQYIKHITEAYLSVVGRALRRFDVSTPLGTSLKSAWDDIAVTMVDVPEFDLVISTLKDILAVNNVQVINSESIYKQPDYSARFNFIIGGTKLSRGVTIKRLITTYYARETGAPKMDTIHQHARMYGYRKDDLDVIRVFITDDLAERFNLINQSDNILREFIVESSGDSGIIPILVGEGMAPTRNNVLSSDEILSYRSGSSYFPHHPYYEKRLVRDYTSYLDPILIPYSGKGLSDSAKEVTLEFMLDILEHIRSKRVSNEYWEDERMKSILKTLKLMTNKGFVVIRQGRKISNNSERGIGAILAAGEDRLAVTEYPTLYVYRLTGEKELGWDDQPFWVPVLRLPDDNNYVFMVNIGE